MVKGKWYLLISNKKIATYSPYSTYFEYTVVNHISVYSRESSANNYNFNWNLHLLRMSKDYSWNIKSAKNHLPQSSRNRAVSVATEFQLSYNDFNCANYIANTFMPYFIHYWCFGSFCRIDFAFDVFGIHKNSIVKVI